MRSSVLPLRVPFCVVLAALSVAPSAPAAPQVENEPQILFAFTGGSDGDHFGWSVAGIGDVDRDGHADVIVGAPDNDAAGLDAGRAFVISGLDGAVLRTFSGVAGDRLGFAVARAGDVNLDGVPDIVVGAPGPDRSTTHRGKALVYSGATGAVLRSLNGSEIGGRFGAAVDGAGDVNGDGRADVLIGAPGDDDEPFPTGRAYLFSAATGAGLRSWSGVSAQDAFGHAVRGVGDLNGDTVPDVVIGAPLDDTRGHDAGCARAYSGANGVLLRTFLPAVARSHLGWSLADPGDVDGDQRPDVMVGARFEAALGTARVFSGRTGAELRLLGATEQGTWAGNAVAGGGDLSGDGVPDLLLGAPLDGINLLLPGRTPATGSVRAYSGASGAPLFGITGPSDQTWFGAALDLAGDVNGDGVQDILIGEPMADQGKGRVELRSGVRLTLAANRYAVPVSSGGVQAMALEAGSAYAGRLYLVLGSASGTRPGVPIAGLRLPLNLDGYFFFTLGSPSVPPLISTLGVLDPTGRAAAGFGIPPGLSPALVGLTLHHAFLVFESARVPVLASNAIPVTFVQ